MKQQQLEYAVRREIRNSPIVREVDRERQREQWRSLGVGVFLAAVVLVSAWQQFELLQHGYRVEQLQQERAREIEINRQLRLEIETLRSPARIERIATERIGLVAPADDEAFVIEHVRPAPPPARSVLAALREQGGTQGVRPH
ncbi:MAG: cell division protein FtsL [Acidobacteria bacterium]|nr:cell division protein FtsL [Acidobacteriota bacterium]